MSSPAYVFLDGRDTYQELEGIGTAGSVAVLPGPGESGVSIIAVEGVKQLELARGKREYEAADIRARISRIAGSSSLAVKGFDIDGRVTGETQILPGKKSPDAKWSIPILPGTVRYDISGSNY